MSSIARARALASCDRGLVKRGFLAVARTGEELPRRRLPRLAARVAAVQASHEQRVDSEINSPHRAQRGTDPPVPVAGEETDDERDRAQCSGGDPDNEEAPVRPRRVSVPWSSHAVDRRTASGEDRITPLWWCCPRTSAGIGPRGHDA
jgi:hypothetical protein